MRRALLLAALALGCDDPQVAGTIAGALENGAIRASLTCSFPMPGSCSFVTEMYSATSFLDGTAFTFARVPQFHRRGTSEAETFQGGASGLVVTAQDGLLSVDGGGCGTDDYAIDTYCTGFNLEAFGVE